MALPGVIVCLLLAVRKVIYSEQYDAAIQAPHFRVLSEHRGWLTSR
jgi:hypothetical protein